MTTETDPKPDAQGDAFDVREEAHHIADRLLIGKRKFFSDVKPEDLLEMAALQGLETGYTQGHLSGAREVVEKAREYLAEDLLVFNGCQTNQTKGIRALLKYLQSQLAGGLGK